MKNLFSVFVLIFCSQVLNASEVSIYFSPSSNHQDIIRGIQTAQKTIQMVIFHLDDKEVEKSLGAAVSRGVKVELIVDGLSLKLPPFSASKKRLEKLGVTVTASSKGFKITHQKTMVVDNEVAYITSMNLTKKVASTRDWGVITHDKSIIAEMNEVFNIDIQNAQSGTKNTPQLKNLNLLWSPVNSEEKLVQLINGAQKTIIGTVENLGNAPIQTALENAASRGVHIKFISPLCDIALNAQQNVPFSKQMFQKGVEAHLMPAPQTAIQPYMHAKMLVADSAKAYIGSINFSDNSLRNSREAGILIDDISAIKVIETEFESDWKQTIAPNGNMPGCSGN